MSRGANEKRAPDLGELVREFRRFHGLGASFFRVAAARTGKTVTDMQVLDILQMTGPTIAGHLAELTGLTTGAITGLLNRLEEAGLVRRVRDPADGRRIIVQLESDQDDLRAITALFDPLWQSWEEMAAGYSAEQRAFLLEFLQRSNELSRREIVRLQEAPAGEGKIYSAPLGDLAGLESARLVFSSGGAMLTLRADAGMGDLYQARFEGPLPEVKAKDGLVAIRYARRLWDWTSGGRKRKTVVTLSTAVPWRILIQSGASEVIAELGGLDLAGLEVKGGMSLIQLNLPVPARSVPIKISGGASEIIVRRPGGVAARVHLKGSASAFTFDEQTFPDLGNEVRMQSPGFAAAAPHYDIEILSSVSAVTLTVAVPAG